MFVAHRDSRKWIEHKFPSEGLPGEGFLLAASVKPFKHGLEAGEVKLREAFAVKSDRIVVIVPAHTRGRSFPELLEWVTVSGRFDPVSEVLDGLAESEWGGLHFQGHLGDSCSAPVKCETQEINNIILLGS